MLPPVTILICTYNRLREIERTVSALREYMSYSGELRWMIADDSSPGNYRQKLLSSPVIKSVLDLRSLEPIKPHVITTPYNMGWGGNVNNGLAQTDTEFVFFIEDDYELTRPLDLDIGITLLLTQPHIGMLRYRATAGEHIVFHQMETNISAYFPNYQDAQGLPGKLCYFLLDGGSPSLYIYSHGAHLKRRSFHEFYGRYPEGLRLGATEEAFCHQVKDGMKRPGAPAIAILPEWVHMHWNHFGESYQHTALDKGQ